MQNQDSDDLHFDRMAAAHRGGKRGYWLYSILLVLLGAGLIIAGYLGHMSWLVASVTGVMAIAVAILPARQAVEHGERVEGLAVLQEEWQELVAQGDSAAEERQQFLALLRRLYSR